MAASISAHHVSQTRDGWTLTGVTLTDHDGPSLTLATTVGHSPALYLGQRQQPDAAS